jgi:hypothetical protein
MKVNRMSNTNDNYIKIFLGPSSSIIFKVARNLRGKSNLFSNADALNVQIEWQVLGKCRLFVRQKPRGRLDERAARFISRQSDNYSDNYSETS